MPAASIVLGLNAKRHVSAPERAGALRRGAGRIAEGAGPSEVDAADAPRRRRSILAESPSAMRPGRTERGSTGSA